MTFYPRVTLFISLFLLGCTTQASQRPLLDMMQCDGAGPVVFEAIILDVIPTSAQLFQDGEDLPLMGVVNLVDVKVEKIISGKCMGQYARITALETTPGWFSKDMKATFTLPDASDLRFPPLAVLDENKMTRAR